MDISSTDHWSQYFANVNESTASFLFDDGISEVINQASQSHSLKIEIKLNDPRDDGLPSENEWKNLNPLIDAITNKVEEISGVYLGSATYSGSRWMLSLIHAPDDSLVSTLTQLGNAHGYRLNIMHEHDPDKSVYWDDLYPDSDSRRVLNDGLILEQLRKHGDDCEAVRTVEHWTIFQDRVNATFFADFLRVEGYKNISAEKRKEGFFAKPFWLVQSQHEGSMLLNDITHHTLKHLRKATQLGGSYDGWETQVIKRKTD